METWYLIIIILMGVTNQTGRAVEHVPFASQEACVSARNDIMIEIFEAEMDERAIIICKPDR